MMYSILSVLLTTGIDCPLQSNGHTCVGHCFQAAVRRLAASRRRLPHEWTRDFEVERIKNTVLVIAQELASNSTQFPCRIALQHLFMKTTQNFNNFGLMLLNLDIMLA